MRNEIGKTVESLTGLVAKEMDTRINERIDHFHEFIISSYLQDFLSQSNMDFEKMVNMQGYIDEKDNEWTAAPKGEITPFMRKLIENDLSEIIRSKI